MPFVSRRSRAEATASSPFASSPFAPIPTASIPIAAGTRTARTLGALVAVLVVTLASTGLTSPAPLLAQPGPGVLDLDHYLAWEDVADPQLSPDGRQVVYTRRFMDPVNDRWASALWIMNVDRTRNRFLVEGSSPQWSPDGTRLAYTAGGDPRGSQIFVRWMDAEGASSQVTRLEHGPGSLAWSPDGTRLLFQAFVPQDPDPAWRISLPRAPQGANWTGAPVIEDCI